MSDERLVAGSNLAGWIRMDPDFEVILSTGPSWFEERLEIQAIADDITSKYVPPHVNIFYCIGGITFTCFIIQVATGFAMTFYYRPLLLKHLLPLNLL